MGGQYYTFIGDGGVTITIYHAVDGKFSHAIDEGALTEDDCSVSAEEAYRFARRAGVRLVAQGTWEPVAEAQPCGSASGGNVQSNIYMTHRRADGAVVTVYCVAAPHGAQVRHHAVREDWVSSRDDGSISLDAAREFERDIDVTLDGIGFWEMAVADAAIGG